MPDQHLIPASPQPLGPPAHAPWYGPEFEPEEPGTPLSHYLWVLRRHRWKIVTFVAASVLATLVLSSRLTPVYEATSTIDIDRRMPSGILGPDSTQSTINDADQFLATQVKLLQSDSVLRPVVQRYKLRTDEQESVPSTEAEYAPVKLPNLKVTRPPNTYLLLVSYRSPDPKLAANVANAVAGSYIEHAYSIRYRSTLGLSAFMEKHLEELKVKVEHSAAALAAFERELNVINPEEKTSILSARLLQLNSEYTAAQADRVRKEAAYNSVRAGSLEAAQASTQGDALRNLTERLFLAQESFAQVKVHYGPNHPEHRKAAAQVSQLGSQLDETVRGILRRVNIEYGQAVNREDMLKKAVDQTKAEFDRLNARSYEYQSLKREAEGDRKVYEELVRKIKEAGINAGFQNSSVRLADPARPAVRPVFPNLRLNLVLAFLFSSLLAAGAAILSDALDRTVRDPEQVARLFNTEAVGSLPLVKGWQQKKFLLKFRPSDPTSLVRVRSAGDASRLGADFTSASTSFAEAIHTLRNSILLGAFDRPVRSLLVTSAGPAEGKTTTAVHLALAHAQQKLRTLLIDGDLRRPGVHRFLQISTETGLSHVLSNGLEWRPGLVKLEALPDLDVLPSGHSSRAAVGLLGKLLPSIVREAATEYDLVVIDSPPVLGFPEPLQMATAVDGVLLVALAGETNRKALGSALNVLQRLRANVVGVVLNEVTSALSESYDYHGYYGKYYRYYRDRTNA